MNHPAKFEYVLNKIKEMIEKGEIKEGERLPSEIEYSKKLGVSRATLREALRILEDEGYVKRYHGVGTFVTRPRVIKSGMEELISITRLIEKQGMRPGTKDVLIERVKPTEKEAALMNIPVEDDIFRIQRVRTADDIPVLYCIDRIPAKYVKKEFNFNKESLFQYLQEDLGIYIAYAVSDVIPVKAKVKNIYKKLEMKSASGVLLLLEQLHFDENNNPIFYSSNYFSPEKFRFYIVRKRV
ncbi:GntR family transcriptional regulator [Thermovenabulum sp.]|uniref:GntR family transcriptional regulator n=1 Tax=Thermovenabulum sp. TaxID=3100335 RepID=UPI003C7ECE64